MIGFFLWSIRNREFVIDYKTLKKIAADESSNKGLFQKF